MIDQLFWRPTCSRLSKFMQLFQYRNVAVPVISRVSLENQVEISQLSRGSVVESVDLYDGEVEVEVISMLKGISGSKGVDKRDAKIEKVV